MIPFVSVISDDPPNRFPQYQAAPPLSVSYHISVETRTEKTASVQRSTILPGLLFKELRIAAAKTHQLVMVPLLDDFPVFQHIDRIDHPDG